MPKTKRATKTTTRARTRGCEACGKRVPIDRLYGGFSERAGRGLGLCRDCHTAIVGWDPEE